VDIYSNLDMYYSFFVSFIFVCLCALYWDFLW